MSDCYLTSNSLVLDDCKGGVGSSIESQDYKINKHD